MYVLGKYCFDKTQSYMAISISSITPTANGITVNIAGGPTGVGTSVTASLGPFTYTVYNCTSSSHSVTWDNTSGYAGYFTPGQSYTVTVRDSVGENITQSITLGYPSLNLTFLTGAASYGLSNLNSIMGTSYTTINTTTNAGSTTYTLTGTTYTQSIRNNSWIGNSYLSSVVDYGTVISVGDSSFQNCTTLADVILPFTSNIGTSAFVNDLKLQNIDISSATYFGGTPFDGVSPHSVFLRGVNTNTEIIFGLSSTPTFNVYPTYLVTSDTFPTMTWNPSYPGTIYSNSLIPVLATSNNLPDGYTFGYTETTSTVAYSSRAFPAISNGASEFNVYVATTGSVTAFFTATTTYSVPLPQLTVSFNQDTGQFDNTPNISFISVSNANQIPVASPISVLCPYNDGLTSNSVVVTASATNNPQGISLVTNPLFGTVNIDNLTITYTASVSSSSQNGSPPTGDNFTFVVYNANGNSNVVTFSVTFVTGANKQPIVSASSFSIVQNSAATHVPLNVVGTYTSLIIISTTTRGTLSFPTSTTTNYQPTLGYVGNDEFTYNVANGYGQSILNATLSINVTAGTLTLSPSAGALTNGVVSTPYASGSGVTFVATGGTSPYTSRITSGSLPNGLTFTPTSTGGTITGSPTSQTQANFSVTVTDSSTTPNQVQHSYSISVLPLPNVTSNFTQTVLFNSVGTALNTAITGAPYSSIQVSTPPSHGTVTTSSFGSTLYYTPTTAFDGTDTLSYFVINANGPSNISTASIVLTRPVITILPAPRTFTTGSVGTPISPIIFAPTGGTLSYTVSMNPPTNPVPGLIFNAVTHELSGTPTVGGTYTFTATAYDSSTPYAAYATSKFTVTIATPPAPPQLISAASFNAMAGSTSGVSKLFDKLYHARSSQVSTTTTSGKLIKANDWNNLYLDVARAYVHQHNRVPDVPGIPATNYISNPEKISKATSATIGNLVSGLIQNYSHADPSQLQTISQSVVYSTDVIETYLNYFNWNTLEDAEGFFNLGGSISTDLANGLVFTASNYSTISPHTVGPITTPTTDGLGTQYLSIFGDGTTIAFSIQIVPTTTGVPTRTTGHIYYTTSISPGGAGIYAISPTTTANFVSGLLTISPLSLQTLTGNSIVTQIVNLKNDSSNSITINSLKFVADPNQPAQLTFVNTPISNSVLAPGASIQVTMSWQNNTTVGGTFNNIIEIRSNSVNNPLLKVNNPVKSNFGISVSPATYTVTANNPISLPLTVTGYGGELNPFSIISSASPSGFAVSGNQYANETFNLYLNTNSVPNGNIIGVAAFDAQDMSGNNSPTVYSTATVTVNVADTHLGHWLSPQNYWNGIIGFSYDIINGLRYLTVGFGMGNGRGPGQLFQGAFPTYSNNAQHHLGIPNILTGPNYNSRNGRYSTFLNTYGIWNSPLGSGTGVWTSDSYTFLVRDTGTYTTEFSADNVGTWSIDGNIVGTQSDGSGYTNSIISTAYLAAGLHTVSWSIDNFDGPGAVGLRITNNFGYDIFSTLNVSIPDWTEVYRIPLNENGVPTAYSLNLSNRIYGNYYSPYFANGSLISMQDNGYGQLQIQMNSVQSTNGDTYFDTTILDAQFLFYYYSANEPRFTQLSSYGTVTPYFTGFDPSGNVTYIVVETPFAPSSD